MSKDLLCSLICQEYPDIIIYSRSAYTRQHSFVCFPGFRRVCVRWALWLNPSNKTFGIYKESQLIRNKIKAISSLQIFSCWFLPPPGVPLGWADRQWDPPAHRWFGDRSMWGNQPDLCSAVWWAARCTINVIDPISWVVKAGFLLLLAFLLVLDKRYCVGFGPMVVVGGREWPDL